MIQTDIHYEVTDTFGGEPNYAWVKRGKIASFPGEEYSDLAAVRRVKKAIGWNNCRTITEVNGDSITIRPRNKDIHQVCFISFYPHGRAL